MAILQRDLSQLVQWIEKWQMKFNPKKCTVMRINSQEDTDLNYYLKIDREPHYLNKSTSEKDL